MCARAACGVRREGPGQVPYGVLRVVRHGLGEPSVGSAQASPGVGYACGTIVREPVTACSRVRSLARTLCTLLTTHTHTHSNAERAQAKTRAYDNCGGSGHRGPKRQLRVPRVHSRGQLVLSAQGPPPCAPACIHLARARTHRHTRTQRVLADSTRYRTRNRMSCALSTSLLH
jgi:hypothetical protein